MAVALHLLATERSAVEEELDLVAVGIGADLHDLAFLARPVPVGEDVQHHLIGPPRLEVVEAVLGEAAGIEDAELRADRREVERRGLAAIVKSGPIHNAGELRSGGVVLPAELGVAAGGAVLQGRHVGALLVGEIDAARGLSRRFLRAEDDLIRVLRVLLIGLGLLDVVHPGGVDRGGDAAPAAADRRGDEARRIEALRKILHGGGDPGPLDIALNPPLLVADRPDDDRGMVAIAADHRFELAEVIRVDAHQAVLVDDEHAETVAGIEQLRRRRIVGGAVGVAAHRLQLPDAKILQRIGQRRAHAGMVLVVVGPLDRDPHAVQEEPGVRVEADGADTEGGLRAVHGAAVVEHGRHQPVEMRRLQGPELGIGHRERGGARLRSAGGERGGGQLGARDDLTGGVGDLMRHRADGRGAALVGQSGFHRHGGGVAGDFRAHPGTETGDVHRRGLGQPDVAVDAGALVEPALLHRGVDAHSDDVVAAVVEIIRDVVARRDVAARLFANEKAVHKHPGVAVDAVKIDADAPAEIGLRNREMPPVPTHAGIGTARADSLESVARSRIAIEGHLDGPVVRHIELTPGTILEDGACGPVAETGLGEIREIAGGVSEIPSGVGRMAQGETPARVEG